MIVMLLKLIVSLICTVLNVYNLLVLAHVVLTWLNIPANKWTELLRAAVEPALVVTRKLMDRFLPSLRKPGIDWSGVVLFIAIWLVQTVLSWLF